MRKIYNIIYAFIMVGLMIGFILIRNENDMLRMVYAATAIIMTSIFTYANRK